MATTHEVKRHSDERERERERWVIKKEEEGRVRKKVGRGFWIRNGCWGMGSHEWGVSLKKTAP